jgi:hypothetical protein
VPELPEKAKKDTRDDWAVQELEPGEGEPAPARFFLQRSSKKEDRAEQDYCRKGSIVSSPAPYSESS